MERHRQTLYDDLKPGSKRKLKIKVTHLTAYKVYKTLSALRHRQTQIISLARENSGSIFMSHSVTLRLPCWKVIIRARGLIPAASQK